MGPSLLRVPPQISGCGRRDPIGLSVDRDRWFADSPLEQGGFEPLVPPPKCARFFVPVRRWIQVLWLTLCQNTISQLALEKLEEWVLLGSDLRQDQVVETGVDILVEGPLPCDVHEVMGAGAAQSDNAG